MADVFLKTFLNDEKSTLEYGSKLALLCQTLEAPPSGWVFFLFGDLGAGKTTLVRGLLRGLGYTGLVKSPTYTLVEPYEFAETRIHHFDLYRLKDPMALDEIGFQDYFGNNTIVLIEWPEVAASVLPPPDVSCYLEKQGNSREITLFSKTPYGRLFIERLRDEN